eukprot:4915910-Pleurochrysis_carterae.AAC.4
MTSRPAHVLEERLEVFDLCEVAGHVSAEDHRDDHLAHVAALQRRTAGSGGKRRADRATGQLRRLARGGGMEKGEGGAGSSA